MEPEIRTKMLKELSENSEQNFLAWLFHGKNCRLDDAFSECFELGAKRKEKEKKERRNIYDFCSCPIKNVVKRVACGNKGMLSCCKRPFWVAIDWS